MWLLLNTLKIIHYKQPGNWTLNNELGHKLMDSFWSSFSGGSSIVID